MKFSKTSIALVIIGILLVVAAPIWKWVIAPQFIKVPDDLDVESVYEGTLKLYADPENLVIYPEGEEINIPVEITRTDVSEPDESSSDVAVVRETVVVKNADTGETLEDYGWDKLFAIDRKTGENVKEYDEDIPDREGYYIMLPFNAEQVTYQLWDDETGLTGDGVFVKEDTRDGVKVYVYEAGGEPEKMLGPPSGLEDYEQLPGRVIKELLNDPNLLIPDDAMMTIEYFKETEATLVVEPRTGAWVDIPEFREAYYVNTALSGEPEYMKLAEIEYKQTEESVSIVVDDVAGYFGLLDLVTMWIPVILLVIGLILVVTGLFLGRKPTEPVEEKSAPQE